MKKIAALSVKQIEYKNAELVLCEFIQINWEEEEWERNYKDFNLQDLHDFIADKIEALDPIINKKRWPYKTKQG